MKKKIRKPLDIAEYQLCCGCGVCAYMYPDWIHMEDFTESGRRPVFHLNYDKQIDIDSFYDICPGYALHQYDKQKHVIESLELAWGPVLELWEGNAVDPEIRYRGSSGGGITAIALYCLEQEKVQGVLQVQADGEKPYLNNTVLNTTRDSIIAAAGSRYSPSSPCEQLHLLENSEQPGVFLGKPCDVAAVNKVMELNPLLREKVFLKIACFCAGTPSTDGTLAMLKQMGVENIDKVEALRYRGYGWPGSAVAKVQNQKNCESKSMTYEKAWGEILHKYRQWRCHICPDHSGEFADLSIGDPWYRDIDKNELGQSLIVVRTRKGQEIIKKAIAHGYISAKKISPHLLPASQPHLLNARARLWGQLFGLRLSGTPTPVYTGFHLKQFWSKEFSFYRKIKLLLGTLRRVYRKKLTRRKRYLNIY